MKRVPPITFGFTRGVALRPHDELHRLTLWLFSTQVELVGLVFTIAKLA